MIETGVWEMFAPIDPMRMGSIAEDPECAFALGTLGLIRNEVMPLVLHLSGLRVLARYVFVVHVSPDASDARPHLHLRLWFTPRPKIVEPPPIWTHVRELNDGELAEIAGVDARVLDGGTPAAWHLLCEQSVWLIDFIAQHNDGVSDYDILRQLVQFSHFSHNMTQLPEIVPAWWKQMERARLGMPTLKRINMRTHTLDCERVIERIVRIAKERGYLCTHAEAIALWHSCDLDKLGWWDIPLLDDVQLGDRIVAEIERGEEN